MFAIPNNIVLQSESDPLYTQANTLDYTERASELGKLYDISTGLISVAANGFLCVQLTNPANSGFTLYIARVSGGSSVTSTIELFRNATMASPASLMPRNRNWSFSDSSSATGGYLNQATDPTTGGVLIAAMVQSGGQIFRDYYGQLIIPGTASNRTLYLRLINTANQINTMAATVTWWELPNNILP